MKSFLLIHSATGELVLTDKELPVKATLTIMHGHQVARLLEDQSFAEADTWIIIRLPMSTDKVKIHKDRLPEKYVYDDQAD